MAISTRLKTYMDENKIPYSVMTHVPAYTAQAVASAVHVSGKELAKTVVLRAGEKTLLAVLPGSRHVNLKKLSEEIGEPVRLATEQEFAKLFPDCEPGAMPPFGQLYGLPVYVDEALFADEEVVFNAGTHRDALRMRFEDFIRLSKPHACSFAETN